MAAMPWPGAVAVSGGADSLALMHLLAQWAARTKVSPPLVLTVDHGLRKGSAADAKAVARWAKALKLKCEILSAKGAKPKSDIEAWARDARLRLMHRAMAKHKLTVLYLAHHQNDQAETFLLRLARGSGLDGLGAMQSLAPFPLPQAQGLMLARPLLAMPRQSLRDFLKAQRQDWRKDPMNDEARFARNRMRALLPLLEEAGLTAGRIADAAAHLARAREALDLATAAVLARAMRRAQGDNAVLLLDGAALAAAPREIGLRALAAVLKNVAGTAYRPRFDALERLFGQIAAKGGIAAGATLNGCRIGRAPKRWQAFGPQTLVIRRESSRAGTSSA